MEAATKHLSELQAQRQAAIYEGKAAYAHYKDLKRKMKQTWKVNKRKDKEFRKEIKLLKKAQKLEEKALASELAILKANLASYKKEIKNIIKTDKAAAALETKLRLEHEKQLAQQAAAAAEEDRRNAELEDARREAELAKQASVGGSAQKEETDETVAADTITDQAYGNGQANSRSDSDVKGVSQTNAKYVDVVYIPSIRAFGQKIRRAIGDDFRPPIAEPDEESADEIPSRLSMNPKFSIGRTPQTIEFRRSQETPYILSTPQANQPFSPPDTF